MSASGMIDSVSANGMLRFVFSSLDEVLLERSRKAMWPTANELQASVFAKKSVSDLISLWPQQYC